ncbi:hypothetical protein INT47_006906 [Mucor saturninus]|uniref:Reverse transcriptase domain-containing protein n=1 Tax=Mucor saturninus TaxID=64648 RepID=A0A8H7QHN7_9FUNG|nr:hypothetical protein INT47_006906 [Mucor saturninus]
MPTTFTAPISPVTSFSSLAVGSLNCCGLAKTADISVRNSFIRYLRTRSLDLLALQESHASTSLHDIFHSQFQAKASLWSSHCGLVSFSDKLEFSNSFISPCEPIIPTTVSHASNAFDPVFVTIVYFPASRAERYLFLNDITQQYPAIFPTCPSRTILAGDFNYSYSRQFSSRIRQAPSFWLHYIDSSFTDSITPTDQLASATFYRGVSRSCIDYVFVSNDLASSTHYDDCTTTYIQPQWSNHLLLKAQFRLFPPISDSNSVFSVGKGLWRAHPRLASNPHFVKQLNRILSKCVHQFNTPMSAAEKWESLKAATATFCKSYSRRKGYTLSCAEDLLHKKRAGITKKLSLDPSLLPVLSPQLTVVEQQLTSLQQYHVDDLALRSGIRWREMGELSAGYLKRTISARQSRQTIPPFLHPNSLSLCSSKDEMLDAAATFYSDLYSPDPIDPAAIDSLLADLPDSLHLSPSASSFMISPLTLDTLLDAFSRILKKSSPGIDGLPYAIVRLIVIHASCSQIAVEVFNNALCFADIPPSWLRSCVTLLPKKPPFDTLKNWRPISLINTDAKVFTRILSSRMIITASKLINPYQTGFVRGRFIADNGLLMKLVMEQARISSSSGIGLLLDQEKAYDRVHPDYLRAVLLRFGYPLTVVDCIDRLFFSTDLQINVNGFLSQCIPQRRGLKQGDPISPILFNLAFEPLLRKIQLDSRIMGYRLPSPVPNPSVDPAKLLAYADDIICLLIDPSELTHLQAHLSLYSRASNAKVNFHKTEAVSLSGASSIYNSVWRSALLSYNITSWHHCQSPAPVVYLGFPLYTSTSQRNLFLDGILDKVSKACQIHQQRGLSVRGRATILSSLVLSEL